MTIGGRGHALNDPLILVDFLRPSSTGNRNIYFWNEIKKSGNGACYTFNEVNWNKNLDKIKKNKY